MDIGMHLGEGWAERIAEALRSCRVFVPLYSPRYFRSVACGQEWDAFATRPVHPMPGGNAHISGIVPVLWVSSPSSLPPVARRLQFNHSDFGSDYVKEGMYALLKLNYFRDAYQLAVHRLAQRIVEVAEQTMVDPGAHEDFLSRRSAFEGAVPSRQLRILVLACDSERLPEGRSSDSYGRSPLDWQPYRPASTRPLVQHAGRVARQLGLHPSIQEFGEEAEAVLRAEEPESPGLLLLDRWALLDPGHRARMKAFDQLNPAWISLMEPWSADDPDCVPLNGVLQRTADEVLRHQRRDSRPTLRGATDGLPTLDAFEAELPKAARKAIYGFSDRTEPTSTRSQPADQACPSPPAGSASGRPSLRTTPGTGPPTGIPGVAPELKGGDPNEPGGTAP
jgi:FxsC-like protein